MSLLNRSLLNKQTDAQVSGRGLSCTPAIAPHPRPSHSWVQVSRLGLRAHGAYFFQSAHLMRSFLPPACRTSLDSSLRARSSANV